MHADRELLPQLARVFRERRIPAARFAGVAEAVQTRSVAVVPSIEPGQLAPLFPDPVQQEVMARLELASALHIPVVVRGELRAILTLGTTNFSGRRFRESDRALGGEVAALLQLAVENSLLVSEMQLEIEERSRAERTARESQERFRLLVEGARDYAMLLLDTGGRIDAWNPGAERMLGFTEEEAIGMPFDRLFSEDDRAAGLPNRELTEARESGSALDERWHLRKDGSRFWASGHTVALHDEHGNVNGFAKIMRDMTGWKLSEEELERRVRERTAELNEAVQELEAFSYSVSHDLRSPLRSIQSFTQFTIEEAANCLEPAQRDYLERVQQAAARLDRLISDLLAYTRVSKNRVPLEPVELDRLVSDIRRDHPEFQEPHARLTVIGPLGVVMGNEAYLTQSLTNLIGNAVKFVPREHVPEVRIWSERRGDIVRLNIQDNGIGVPAEHYDRIFRIFERLHPRGEYEGTGVGLAIVRRALQRMNGTVGLAPAPTGRGSIFWIELPPA
jgi:PAS domain S-box-containing protein